MTRNHEGNDSVLMKDGYGQEGVTQNLDTGIKA